MRNVALLVALGWMATTHNLAVGGVITNHASALVYVEGYPPYTRVTNYGDTVVGIPLQSNGYPAYGAGNITGSASAQVGGTEPAVMRLTASGHNIYGAGFQPQMTVAASGIWRDITFLATPGVPAIQLTFRVEGNASFVPNPAPGPGFVFGTAEFVAIANPYIDSQDNFIDAYTSGLFPVHLNPGFSGATTFSLTVTYNATYGGYPWTLYAAARVPGLRYADGLADFGNTVQLTSVSLPNGTPIDPAALRFDSGLVLGQSSPSTAVPEPAAILPLGVLALTGAIRARRRRRRVAGDESSGSDV